MNKTSGFSLVEIIVVVAVIGILATTLILSINESTSQSRDAERKASLRNVQGALELYKNKYGRYPEACNGLATDWDGDWAGEVGSDYECDDGSAEYIRNDLAATTETENFSPQFIPVLPTDPFTDGDTSISYVYATNPEGTVYKFMAMNGVEEEVLQYLDPNKPKSPFLRCGDMTLGVENECTRVSANPGGGGTTFVYNSNGITPTVCNTSSTYNNDYAVWGGYAPGGGSPYRALPKAREHFSDIIRCK